ncbi:NhaP-type Na+/H+ or K+/H+ antiporter [Deinobacterium chartae]|uniref:NhaP-type Na+/H+ or K+/H+ antiporter n=1 Tax=Deinobacterium chartae TaxID=521158 RepID=A0A841I339_9DEIO|nr:cation:proton antiporter [Deinobacterium chartae]MBB6099444.1 NhaP-type Na+/H+ or K+/H+ antiporter [Deinobacterium chartae]
MSPELWFVLIGLLLIAMAVSGSLLKRLPLTSGMFYLFIGVLMGPLVLGAIDIQPMENSAILERVTEVLVIISLFSAGLKLRLPLRDRLWWLPVRLASISMVITVGLIALVGVTLLGLPLGAAILLGAVLAPTDPVLASDVQVEHPDDRDRLRFGLTGEASLNDGTAFPFVMLGLGLLGLHDLGAFGWRWVAVDLIWAVLAGLGVGALAGTLVGKLVLYLRREHREAVGLDDFLGLGLIALSYGVALLLHAYGFLAVFAAGLALRRIERHSAEQNPQAEEAEVPDAVRFASAAQVNEEIATDRDSAPAYMAQALLGFSEQLERIGIVGVVLVLGATLSPDDLRPQALWFIPLLLLVIRPLAVLIGLLGQPASRLQRGLTAWFGIRGVGSVYYLMYAVEHGVPDSQAGLLISLTLLTIATSIVIHGISVTPLMRVYGDRASRRPES